MAKLPRKSLCRLLLWHFVFDDYASGASLDIARFHADYAAEEYDGASWSWFRPDIIVTWHRDFTWHPEYRG